jgi:hypothetical protein
VHGPAADPLIASAAVAETLRRRAEPTEVRIERAGPHVVAVATGALQVTVAVPVPGEPVLAILAVTTPAARDLATYRRVALDVAASLRLA